MHVSDPLQRRLIPAQAQARGDDPIFALNAEARRRKEAGEDVVNSTLGALLDDDLELATLPAVGEAYRRIPNERGAGYAPIAGPPAFLEAVKQDLFADSELAREAVVVATPGGTGACAVAVANFLEAGESLLTGSFYWSPYETIATQAARKLRTFNMFTADGRLDVEALAAALRRLAGEQERVLLFVNNPCHNPTGYTMDQRDWDGLVAVVKEACASQRVTVLFDVAYARYGAGDPYDWVRHVEPLYGHATLLVAWSASKGFLQYGARVGACVALERDAEERKLVRAALGAYCRGSWSNCNHLGMLAITECLTDPELRARADAERDELRRLLERRVAAFTRLAAQAHIPHPRYEGGFFVTVFTPDSEKTAAKMRESGVFVVPLPGAVRVAICSTPERSIPRLVQALREGVDAAGVPA